MKGIFKLMVISLLNAVIHCDPPPCPELKTCDCFWDVGIIRCDDTAVNLTDAALNTYGKSLTGNWSTLEITNTSITTILAGTFSSVEFKRIIIHSNPNLVDIQNGAFKTSISTIDLLIKNNLKFVFSSAPNVMPSFPSIKNVELNGNNIIDLKPNSFNLLSSLETIYLDRPKLEPNSAPMTIESLAFNNLAKLKRLNLDGNKLVLQANAINLTLTVDPGAEELLIFLNNTGLDVSNILPTAIIPPTFKSSKFMVFLNNNTLTALKDGLINKLAEKGIVYLSGEHITCVCEDIPQIAKILKPNSEINNHIQGIYHSHLCGTKAAPTNLTTALVDCPTKF